MKTRLIILLLMLFAGSVMAQEHYTSTVSATDSLGTAFRVMKGEFLTSVSTPDSLTGLSDSLADASKTLYFYVFTGDTVGYYQDTTATLLETAGWKIMTDYDTGTTDYSVILVKTRDIPLYFQQMAHYIGVGRTESTKLLYIVPYISGGIGTDATLTFIGQVF
jgi:hypothetical protein